MHTPQKTEKEAIFFNIHALHGFLGTPQDWTSLDFGKDNTLITYDFFKDLPILPYDDWAKKFNLEVSLQNQPHNLLLGYSLGGRLGLHALLQSPEKWKGGIFLSVHPGLRLEENKKTRIVEDKKWAERFLKEDWDSVIRAWNAQAVFQNGNMPPDYSVDFSLRSFCSVDFSLRPSCSVDFSLRPSCSVDFSLRSFCSVDFSLRSSRKEEEYNRNQLALALTTWSLGNQKNLEAQLADLNKPILWMVGAQDRKFLEIAQKLVYKHPKSSLCVIPNAGHRLLWDQPELCRSKMTQFIQNLNEETINDPNA